VDLAEIANFADRVRLNAVRMVAPHGFGYLGQALSSAELIATLSLDGYRPGTDQIVCSPGHYIIANFAAAAETGQLDKELLSTYGHDDSTLEAIGTERSPAVDLTCGSLGTGLSGAVGFALSNRFNGDEEARVYVLVSDGEMEEGQVWEAAMFAAHHQLGRLIVLLDANDSQVDGPVSSITTIEPIAEKWRSFGWHAADVDGHDVKALRAALEDAKASSLPSVIIARTATDHGLDALPEDVDGHFIKLPAALADSAVAELEARLV
jgi:transketolase